MSRITFGSGLGLCFLLAACVAPPIGARIGLSAPSAAPAAAPAPAVVEAPEPPPAAAEPAPMVDAAPEFPATNGPLTVGGQVAGTLAAEGLRRFAFTVTKGHYLVELFVKAPVQQVCNGSSGADITILDRDEARVGNPFGGYTYQHDAWEKRQELVELAAGPYQLSLLARKGCRVNFRIRLSVAP